MNFFCLFYIRPPSQFPHFLYLQSMIEEPTVTTPRNAKSSRNATPRRSPIKTRSSTKTPPSATKTKHHLPESASITPTRSPAGANHKYFTRSKPNAVSESIELPTPNTGT